MKKTGQEKPSSRSQRNTGFLPAQASEVYLGIEGGATRSTAMLIDSKGSILARSQGGPFHARLTTAREMVRLCSQFQSDLRKALGPSWSGRPLAVGIFVAGCRTRQDELNLKKLLQPVWPKSRLRLGNDTLSAMAASLGTADGVTLVCGTGSVVKCRKGTRLHQVGGWGHMGGDRGSGYWMGRELLRQALLKFDELGELDPVGQSIIAFLGLSRLEELVQWSMEASKDEVASLAKILFQHKQRSYCSGIIREASRVLAADVALAVRKAGFRASSGTLRSLPIALRPGLPTYQPYFGRRLMSEIRKRVPAAEFILSNVEGAFGAAILAAGDRQWAPLEDSRHNKKLCEIRAQSDSDKGSRPASRAFSPEGVSSQLGTRRGLWTSPTEQRNPRSMDLDKKSISQIIDLMLTEEERVPRSIRKESRSISRVIEWVVDSQRKGGRLFYIGAGTSGRLGVLDAAECPPTFSSDPEQIQGIIAGGRRALYQAVESAEDHPNDGRQAIWNRGVRREDVVIGIAASGSTPFVLGALQEAWHLGAKCVLLTFNPHASFQLKGKNFLKIAVETGPEVVTGSTRLKAGTATKLILNLISTITMVRLGKVKSNLMVDLEPTCEKLHDRAARIYSALRGGSHEEAWETLKKHDWQLRKLLNTRGSRR